jgi:hypothetical protein
MTVYIAHEARGRDLTDALQYGDLEVLITADEQAKLSARSMILQMEQRLRNFSSRDYLMLSGDPVCIGVACALAARINDGKIKVLKWDRIEEKYYPIIIDLGSFEKQNPSIMNLMDA